MQQIENKVTFVYNRIIAKISQGVLRDIRNEMFVGMQSLPIKYFDTHTYGEVMSYYTNDADTLREMISRSIPQFISSFITIITVFCAMVYTSIYLTLMTLVFVVLMFIITGMVGGKASKYFIGRQKAIADLNGYVEEMINGQRVIKVFTYEERAKDRFDIVNETLCKNATKANQYANILGPILNNMGHLQYACVGFVGGILALNNIGGLTLGAIASFISLSKGFLSPISQVSQQLNSIIMALAGAARVFNLMDEEVEVDNGYVRLVNIEKDGDEIREVNYNTGCWAWKKNDEYIKKEEPKKEEVKEEVVELVEAMSDFGDYATAYFAEGTIAETPEMEKVTEDTLASHVGEVSENSIYYGSSLLLKSDTILRHYFTEEVPGSTKKGDLYYIDSEGIPAHNLGKELVTEVGDIEITYNPLSYAYIALSREGIDEELKSVVHAMYLYYQAAQEYKVVTNN